MTLREFRDGGRPATDLIHAPLVRACIVKWNEGREKHGLCFKGDPLPDAFEECIDGINYLDQAELMMPAEDREQIAYCRNLLMLCAERIQELWRKRRG
jgi:hypothetical protein